MLCHIWAFPGPQFFLEVLEQVMARVLEPKPTTAQQRKSAQLFPGRPGSDSHRILAAHCPTSLAGPGDLESLELANPSTTASPVLTEAPRRPLAASSAG